MADIKYLPGWHWVAKGKETWERENGTTSTEKHAIDPTGKARSVRYTQDRQKKAEAAQGIVRPPSKPRTGKIRTIYGQTGGRKTGGSGTNRGQVILVFRDFDSARNYVVQNGLGNFRLGLIQIRYTERLNAATNPGSDKSPRGGYSTLTSYQSISVPKGPHAGEDDIFVIGAYTTTSRIGSQDNPWEEAKSQLNNYDMTGDNARVYIYLKS